MTTTSPPFIPGEEILKKSVLPDMAMSLVSADAKLGGKLAPATKETICQHMAVINSYYSNLIEGNRTQPHEIRAAQRGEFSADPSKRDLQMESLAHIHVQNRIKGQSLEQDKVYAPEFFRMIHGEFYSQLPESMREISNGKGNLKATVIPGEWRKQSVEVGRHIPPAYQDLETLMNQFCDVYNPGNFQGDKKMIAVMSAHHRFAWIHPFLDGNGRVGRLFTDTALSVLGLNSVGVWCLSRGLARSADEYKNALARADFDRQGSHDGRGLLSETNLVEFCEYMLRTALDQIEYISALLRLDKMQTRIKSYIQARNDDRVPGISGKLNEVSALILYHAFINGELERAMAYELCAMPDRSARRVIQQLKDDGLLTETSSRSPLRWAIPEHAEPWYFPELVPVVK